MRTSRMHCAASEALSKTQFFNENAADSLRANALCTIFNVQLWFQGSITEVQRQKFFIYWRRCFQSSEGQFALLGDNGASNLGKFNLLGASAIATLQFNNVHQSICYFYRHYNPLLRYGDISVTTFLCINNWLPLFIKWLYRQAKCHASWCYANSLLRSHDCD